MLSWLRTRQAERHKAAEIYGAVVTQARRPAFFAEAGVPDTPEGRYEAIVLHLFLVLERLRAAGDAAVDPSRRLIEAFVTDMDDQMREVGVSDLTVPKKVKRAAALFYERSAAYRAALDAATTEALATALRLVFPAAGAATEGLAAYVRAAVAALAAQDTEALLEGRVTFPEPSFSEPGFSEPGFSENDVTGSGSDRRRR